MRTHTHAQRTRRRVDQIRNKISYIMHVNLDTLNRLTTKDVKPLKEYITGKNTSFKNASFTLGGIVHTITDCTPVGEQYGFTLTWTDDDGNHKQQRIGVAFKPCNLPNKTTSSCMMFICPYKGVLCRKLYTDGKKFFSRYALTYGFTYSSQRRTPKERKVHRPDIPKQRNRKTTYNGKTTPFGRRLQKALDQDARADYQQTLETSRLLCKFYARRLRK